MDCVLFWRHFAAAVIITITSVDESRSECPGEYWDESSKRCSYPLASVLEQLRVDDSWTSALGVNKTCAAWQQTNFCYKDLMKQCNGDREAVQELHMHVGRYWIYSLTCSHDRDVRHRHMLVDCFLPYLKETRTCADAFDTFFRQFVNEQQYSNACRVVSSATRCFDEIKGEINRRCGSVGSTEYQRHYIQPLVDQTRDTVLAHCTLLPPYERYYNNAPSTISESRRYYICLIIISTLVALSLSYLSLAETSQFLAHSASCSDSPTEWTRDSCPSLRSSGLQAGQGVTKVRENRTLSRNTARNIAPPLLLNLNAFCCNRCRLRPITVTTVSSSDVVVALS